MKLKFTLTIITGIIAACINAQISRCSYSGLSDTLKISSKGLSRIECAPPISSDVTYPCHGRTMRNGLHNCRPDDQKIDLSRTIDIFETSSSYNLETDYVRNYESLQPYKGVNTKKKKLPKTAIKKTDNLIIYKPKLNEQSISDSNISISFKTENKAITPLTTKVYPNPFSSTLNIKSNQAIQKITLFNAAGMLIEMITMDANTLDYGLNLSNLQAGFYFINLLVSENTVIEKIQKI